MSPHVRAEEPLAVSEAPREAEESADMGRFKTIAATSLGATGGVVGTYITGFMICDLAGFGGEFQLDCLGNPFVLSGAVLGGIAGGYSGYKRGPLRS